MLLIQELIYKLKINQILLWFWSNKGLVLRALFCWIIGLIILQFDEKKDYDLRLQIRGVQKADTKIVIIRLPFSSADSPLSQYKEASFFSWERYMAILQQASPQVVAFTFIPNHITNKVIKSFQESTIPYLFSSMDYSMAKTQVTQPYVSGLFTDSDGVVRRFRSYSQEAEHLLSGLALKLHPQMHIPSSFVINFRGTIKSSFTVYSALEVISPGFQTQLLKDKIILVAPANEDPVYYRTPIGELSRIEILANALDNLLNYRWIKRIPKFWSKIFLLLLTILGLSLVLYYPQFISFLLFLWISTAITTLSIWLFDTFYFWTPILSPLFLLGLIYIIFISYQLSLKENLTWRLQQEKKYLFEVEQLKTNFVSLISHDLKTPIAKIQAIVDRLLVQKLSSEIQTDLTQLRNESTELHKYIQSILKITRVESQEFKLTKSPQDINKIIQDVVSQLSTLAQSKSIQIQVDLEPLFLIDVDKMLINEVLINLVENAIKYSPKSSEIKIASSELDDKIVITIEDHGPGISKEEQKNIFKKFHRGKEHSLHTKGSGLGLYLVKYFIELHQGEIFIESELGAGTTVIITLPMDDL